MVGDLSNIPFNPTTLPNRFKFICRFDDIEQNYDLKSTTVIEKSKWIHLRIKRLT